MCVFMGVCACTCGHLSVWVLPSVCGCVYFCVVLVCICACADSCEDGCECACVCVRISVWFRACVGEGELVLVC